MFIETIVVVVLVLISLTLKDARDILYKINKRIEGLDVGKQEVEEFNSLKLALEQIKADEQFEQWKATNKRMEG